jgi:hypothetical protein
MLDVVMTAPISSLLNSYDPTNPSSIDGSLTGAGLSDSYYAQGANGTTAAPGTESPTTVPLVGPTPATTAATGASGPNVYQQALSSLQLWSDQTLIQSALGGSSTATSGSSPDDSSSLTASLENAAETQASAQAAQQQAALSAANSALTAGTNVDTTA